MPCRPIHLNPVEWSYARLKTPRFNRVATSCFSRDLRLRSTQVISRTSSASRRSFFSLSDCRVDNMKYRGVEGNQAESCRVKRVNSFPAFQFKVDSDTHSLGSPVSALSFSLKHLHKNVVNEDIEGKIECPETRMDVNTDDAVEAALARFHDSILQFSSFSGNSVSRVKELQTLSVSSVLVEAERAMEISVQHQRPKEALDVFWALNSTGLLPFSTKHSIFAGGQKARVEGKNGVPLAQRLGFLAQQALQALPHRQLQAQLVQQLLEAEDTNADIVPSCSSAMGVPVLQDNCAPLSGMSAASQISHKVEEEAKTGVSTKNFLCVSSLSPAEQFRRQLYREEQMLRRAKLLSSHFSQGFYLSKIRDVLHEIPSTRRCDDITRSTPTALPLPKERVEYRLRESLEVSVLCRLSFALLWHPQTLLLLQPKPSTEMEGYSSHGSPQWKETTVESKGNRGLSPSSASSPGWLPWRAVVWLPVPLREGLLQLEDQTAPVLEMLHCQATNDGSTARSCSENMATSSGTTPLADQVNKELKPSQIPSEKSSRAHPLLSLLTHLCAEWDGILIRRVLNDILLPAAAHNIFVPLHGNVPPSRSVSSTTVSDEKGLLLNANNQRSYGSATRDMHHSILDLSFPSRMGAVSTSGDSKKGRKLSSPGAQGLAVALPHHDLTLAFSQYLFPSPESAGKQFHQPSGSLLRNPSFAHARLALLLCRRRFQYILVPDAAFILRQTRRLWELGKYREIIITHSVLLELLYVAQGGCSTTASNKGCGSAMNAGEKEASSDNGNPSSRLDTVPCWWEVAGFTQSASATCSPRRFAARRVLCEILSRTMSRPEEAMDKEWLKRAKKGGSTGKRIVWQRNRILRELSSSLSPRWSKTSDTGGNTSVDGDGEEKGDGDSFSVSVFSSPGHTTTAGRTRRIKRRQRHSEGPSTISFVDDRPQIAVSKASSFTSSRYISNHKHRNGLPELRKGTPRSSSLSYSSTSTEQQELLCRLRFYFLPNSSKTSLERRGRGMKQQPQRQAVALGGRVRRPSSRNRSPLAPSGGVTILGMLDELALLEHVDQLHASHQGADSTAALLCGPPPLLPLLSEVSPLGEEEKSSAERHSHFLNHHLSDSAAVDRCSSYSAMACARALQRLFEINAGSSGNSSPKRPRSSEPGTGAVPLPLSSSPGLDTSRPTSISKEGPRSSGKDDDTGNSSTRAFASFSFEENTPFPLGVTPAAVLSWSTHSDDRIAEGSAESRGSDDVERCLDAIFANPIGDTPVTPPKDYACNKKPLHENRNSSLSSSSAVLHHAPLFQSRRRSFWSRQEVLLASQVEETRVSAYLLGTNLYPPASGFY